MAFVENLAGLIERVSIDVPPRRVQRFDECRYCDLTPEDCTDRVEAESGELLTTAEF